MIEFASKTERAVLLDPSGNRWEQAVEQRIDPLTGTVASVNPAFADKAKAFLGTADVELLRDLAERSRATCPFCHASEKGTRYVPERLPEGQLRVGRALAIPNLFAKCAADSVVILDPARHVVFPSELPAETLADGLRAAAELTRRAREWDPALVHVVAGMNLLGPAGSSVPHPHLQVHVRSVPYSGLARTARLAAEFRARTGASFFDALLEAERGGPRHVGRTGAVEWLAPFAPMHQKEIWGVLPGTASLADLSDADAEAYGAGLAKVLASYEADGVHALNFAVHSAPDAGAGAWALHVKVCARPAFRAQYTNYETWFAPLFVGDDAHVEAPETYAGRLRARW